jgi:hypothetical protein
MSIDVHAHYVPPQLIDAVAARGKDLGVRLVRSDGAPPALHFDYGFKVRPFFPRLIEPVRERRAWLDAQGIDLQVVGTWPDIRLRPRRRRLRRLAPDAQRHAGGVVRGQRGPVRLDRLRPAH